MMAENKFQTIVTYCTELYEELSNSAYRKRKLKAIKASRETYEQKKKSKKFPWKDCWNLTLPFGTITVDNLEPRFVSGLAGRDPIISFQEGDDDKEPETELIETWYNKELKNTIGIEERVRPITHNLLIDGTVYPKAGYDIMEETSRDFVFDEDKLKQFANSGGIDPESEDLKRFVTGKRFIDPKTGTYATVEITEEIFHGGTLELLSPDKVYVPDDVGTIQEWNDCPKIVQISYTYAELMRLRDKGDVKDGITQYGYIQENISKDLLGTKTTKENTEAQNVAEVDITGKEIIPAIQCHVSFCPSRIGEEEIPEEDQTDFEEERYLVEIVEGQDIIIRFIKQSDILMSNRPLIGRMRLFPEEGQSMGTSVIEKIRHIQDGGSDVFCRMMDAGDIALIPFYFYEDGAGVSDKQLVYPGAGIKVSDITKIKPHEVRANTGQAMEALNFMIALWERMVNLSNPQLGRTTGKGEGDNTATEILSVIQEGNIKHNYQSKTTKDEFVEILKTLYDYYYQYMPEDVMVEFNDKPTPLPRHRMRRQKKFILTGSTEQSNKLIERKETEDFSNGIIGNPMFRSLANPQKIWEDFLNSHNRKNISDYTDPELAQILQLIEAAPELKKWIMDNIKAQLQEGEQ